MRCAWLSIALLASVAGCEDPAARARREALAAFHVEWDAQQAKREKLEAERDAEEKTRAASVSPEQRARAFRDLATKTDDMEGIVWREDRATKQTFGDRLKLYFGEKDGAILPLRLFIMHNDARWLFVERASIKVDDAVFEYAPAQWQRDNTSEVFEWSDSTISRDAPLLTAMVRARAIKIRFHGNTRDYDWAVPQAQIAALPRVYSAWHLSQGLPVAAEPERRSSR